MTRVSRGSLASLGRMIVVALAPAPPAAAPGRSRIGEIHSYSGAGGAFTAPYTAAIDMALEKREYVPEEKILPLDEETRTLRPAG